MARRLLRAPPRRQVRKAIEAERAPASSIIEPSTFFRPRRFGANSTVPHCPAGPRAKGLGLRDYALVLARQTSEGGTCVNASALQFGHNDCHTAASIIRGSQRVLFYGFPAFSHERAALEDKFSIASMLFPPYTKGVKQMIKVAVRYMT
jgi:hypothetical protein